jgi:hypothetical protein
MDCEGHYVTYTPGLVNLNCKVGWAALLAALTVLGAGCGGINASQGVSPATFLLPGLMQADPAPADSVNPVAPLPAAAPAVQLAQAR